MLFHIVTLLATSLLFTGCHGLLCACNTASCREQGLTTCNATAMCYVQFLELGDGSDPLVRGCIASKTPLLCENRRPALAVSWPVLACCAQAPMCNRDAVPPGHPPPPSTAAPHPSSSSGETPDASTGSTWGEQQVSAGATVQQQSQPRERKNGHQQTTSLHHPPSVEGDAGSGGSGISATYGVLLAVACSLLVLVAGALTLFLLRRRALASGHYGAMHGGYLKGHHAPRDCTSGAEAGLCGKPPSNATS